MSPFEGKCEVGELSKAIKFLKFQQNAPYAFENIMSRRLVAWKQVNNAKIPNEATAADKALITSDLSMAVSEWQQELWNCASRRTYQEEIKDSNAVAPPTVRSRKISPNSVCADLRKWLLRGLVILVKPC